VVDFGGKKVLMVETNLELAKQCQYRLRRSKASSKVVADGISALKTLSEDKYDFVYINSDIPFVSGLEILRNIKNRKLTTSPIVFFTSKQNEKLKEEVQRLGASGYYVQVTSDADEIISAMEPFLE
jgi:DNA-binding response OmpR family regulator